jgi:glycosyltransferase involved in cell wall biosynthesis
MSAAPSHVHCELAPILVNRTAVYKMCLQAPGELQQRGFHVTCSALLARLSPNNAEPCNRLERHLLERSRRWLLWAIQRPGWFRRTHRLAGMMTRWRHGGTLLSLDPLYPLFHGAPDRGVAIAYDITPITNPEWHPPGVDALYDEAYAHLARSRFHIVASCQHTADQLQARWAIPPSRITVLPLGLFAMPESDADTPANNVEPPFFLFVGTVEPRKNVAGLIRAYADSGLFAERGIRLRLVGMKNAEDHPIMVQARSTPGVDLAGFVSDGELAAAYRQCLAFVYPSFCEGFGLPLLEAMHRGCLCLSTRTGASPEVAGDAALYVDPYDVADIAHGLRQIAALDPKLAISLRQRARQRASGFTWRRFYDGLADVLRAVESPDGNGERGKGSRGLTASVLGGTP